MAYDSQSVYTKYLHHKHNHDCHNEGCSDSSPCSDCQSRQCGCCPPGLVEVTDELGNQAGCLTPTDAAEYVMDKPCPTGYVKLFDSASGKFLGCVTPADAKTFNS